MTNKICSVKDCPNPIKARGLCNRHYLALYRKGGLSSEPNRTETAILFVEMCLSSDTNECLEPSFQPKSTYPAFIFNGIGSKIGWLILERKEGVRPEGNEMRHLCGNTRCCNPKHLTWGTHLENMDDWKRHGCAGDRAGENNPNYRHGKYVRSR